MSSFLFMREGFAFKNFTTAGTTKLVDARKAFLKAVLVNSIFVGTIKVYDSSAGTPVGTTATDRIVSTIGTPSIAPQVLPYNARMINGLTIVTSGTPEVTVVYE